MNLVKTKEGLLGIMFKRDELDTMLEVLNSFKPLTKESADNLEMAKREVLQAMCGNATIN